MNDSFAWTVTDLSISHTVHTSSLHDYYKLDRKPTELLDISNAFYVRYLVVGCWSHFVLCFMFCSHINGVNSQNWVKAMKKENHILALRLRYKGVWLKHKSNFSEKITIQLFVLLHVYQHCSRWPWKQQLSGKRGENISRIILLYHIGACISVLAIMAQYFLL